MIIAFCGGGTLGHVTPALPVIKQLKIDYPDCRIIYFACENGLERKRLEKMKEIDKIYYLDVQGFDRNNVFKNISIFIKYRRCIKHCKKILGSENPDIVIGMGGYVSLSAIKAAISLKIKTIIHEQNTVLGLANKLVLNKVNSCLLSMEIEELANYKKVKLIGNPRVSEINQKYYGINTERKKTILAVGGSRGANKINDTIIALKDEFKKHELVVTLITGKKYYKNNINLINSSKCSNLIIIPFTDDLIPHLLRSEVIISRSGASTISEIIGLRKASILIPSPNVTKNHQFVNAQNLEKKGAAIVIEESDMSQEKVINNILLLVENEEKRKELINNIIKNYSCDALDLFIKEIKAILNE